MNLSKYSDRELLDIALDYADDNFDFDDDFIRSLHECLEQYDELTVAQRYGLENTVKKFRMII